MNRRKFQRNIATHSQPQTKPAKAPSLPSNLGKGYPKSYPMIEYPAGQVGLDVEKCSDSQFVNYHIEYHGWEGVKPLKQGETFNLPVGTPVGVKSNPEPDSNSNSDMDSELITSPGRGNYE